MVYNVILQYTRDRGNSKNHLLSMILKIIRSVQNTLIIQNQLQNNNRWKYYSEVNITHSHQRVQLELSEKKSPVIFSTQFRTRVCR